MSGHSKWNSIKHQKASADAKRGAAFTRLANAIAVAAKNGTDPEMNFALRIAIDKAKAANMPSNNIDRSIKRGSGQLGGAVMEEILYEGYGPGGVAVLVETATDNRNRTAADVRSTFSKLGGSMGTTGSVAYQFAQKGVIEVEADDILAAMDVAIEAGAADVEEQAGGLTVLTAPTSLDAVRSAMVAAGLKVTGAQLQFIPSNTITVTDEKQAQTLMKLMDALDEHDDVVNTYANFEFSNELSEKLSA